MKIKLFAFYTDDYVILKDKFLSTIQDDFELNIEHIESIDGDNNFGSEQFIYSLKYKIDTIYKKIKESLFTDDIIIVTDLDVQFFGKCSDMILQELVDCDILFLKEFIHFDLMNGGFVVIRPNERTLELYRRICEVDLKDVPFYDQGVIQNLLLKEKIDIRWKNLSTDYFYANSHKVDIPENIIFHHANDSVPRNDKTSMQLKIEQLDEVRNIVEERRKK